MCNYIIKEKIKANNPKLGDYTPETNLDNLLESKLMTGMYAIRGVDNTGVDTSPRIELTRTPVGNTTDQASDSTTGLINADPQQKLAEADLRLVFGKYLVKGQYSSGMPAGAMFLTNDAYEKAFEDCTSLGQVVPPNVDCPYYSASTTDNTVPVPDRVEELTIETPQLNCNSQGQRASISYAPRINLNFNRLARLLSSARAGNENSASSYSLFVDEFGILNENLHDELVDLLQSDPSSIK